MANVIHLSAKGETAAQKTLALQTRTFDGQTVGITIIYNSPDGTPTPEGITLQMDVDEALELVSRLANSVRTVAADREHIDKWKNGWRHEGYEDAKKMRPFRNDLKGKPAFDYYQEGYAQVTKEELEAEERCEKI